MEASEIKALEKKALERITRSRMSLVLREPFFGSLAIRLRPTAAWWLKTAAVDGKHLFYSPAFIDTLTNAQLRGLICHEVLHCANGHCWRRDNREPQLFNIACDYAINPICLAAKFELPEGGCVDARFNNMAAEPIYAILRNEKSESPKPKHSGPGGEGDPQEGPRDPRAPNYEPTFGEVMDAPQETATQDEATWKMAVQQAIEAAKHHGKLPQGLERLVDDFVQPKVDWRSVLRRFIQMNATLDYDWRMPSRRYQGAGFYMPHLQSEQMPPIVIGVDTSGSIVREELAAFMSEVGSIIEEAKPESAHVVFCDAAIGEVREYLPGDPLTYRITGGGGTSFKPVFEWVEENGIEPACLIYLTDCMGDYPEELPPYPTLWASSTKEPGRYEPPFGEFLYIGE